MAFVLKLLAALGFFITVCECECHFEKQKMPPRGMTLKGCWRDGDMHPFNSKWETTDCQECNCHEKGMQCCSHDSIAVGYNPKICIAFKVNCTYTVVRKKDHSIACPFKVVELNSDSSSKSDSSDSIDDSDNKSKNPKSKSKSNEADEFSMQDYLDLLSYLENCNEEETEGEPDTEVPYEIPLDKV